MFPMLDPFLLCFIVNRSCFLINCNRLGQKQPFRSILRKRYTKNMQQIYRTPIGVGVLL